MASKPGGDWRCKHCACLNFSKRTKCFYCNKSKPFERKPGDWVCECGSLNFASKSVCYKCAKPKPGLGGAPAHNDWSCTVCGFMNFQKNDECKKCGVERSFKELVDSKLKEIEEMKKRAEKELESVRRLGTADSQMCAICTENPKNAICTPCNHIFACMECVKKIQTCSLCRERIESVKQVYL